MDPNSYLKRQKFSPYATSVISKETVRGWYHPLPLGSLKVKHLVYYTINILTQSSCHIVTPVITIEGATSLKPVCYNGQLHFLNNRFGLTVGFVIIAI